ncbi:secreted frizzled-related protein 2-like isoform X2 [Engystomops pustulosus]|uniref:secreted frizzled-related protein 2-like isoform X2 n=1 Tax=Engystomops pustulosus TaxID=76066 RepID=UPI003AFA656D
MQLREVFSGLQHRAFDIGLSTRCVSIPKELGICQHLGYTEMRLPNLMGHTTIPEVASKTAEWHKLLQTGCHPYARMFLCSLFAPVCLDTFIQPCRSMCQAVRDSCAPVLACHDQSWPESLNCDRFPAGDDMCLDNLSKEYQNKYEELPKPTCQGCPFIEESYSYRSALGAFCDNGFAVKVKLTKRKFASGHHEYVTEGQVDFIKQGLLLPYNTRNMIEQWLKINENCANRMIRHSKSMIYILAGDIQHGKVVVNRVFHWQKKDTQLTVATRKWKHHKC